MRKCAFILPYYGKFPNYFQLFLKSCGANPDFDWLVFTDDRTTYDYPANVHVHYETFKDMQRRVANAFDFRPQLHKPYKLCDLKPMYGCLFKDYLKNYRFWGHCDCDLVFGKLNHFITDELLDEYDKLFVLGHCALYRNTEENNRRFMLPLDGKEIYREVLSNDRGYTFDESFLPTNINRIYEQHGIPVYSRDCSGNVKAKCSIIQITRYAADLGVYLDEKPIHAVYEWNHGVLTRKFFRMRMLQTSEFMYLHFQRRKMRVAPGVEGMSSFQILPNSFEAMPVDVVDESNFSAITWKHSFDQICHWWSIIRGDAIFWKNRIIKKYVGDKTVFINAASIRPKFRNSQDEL